MPALPPRIIGPVSVCNSTVIVRGALPDATILIYIGGRDSGEGLYNEEVGSATTTGAEQEVPLHGLLPLPAFPGELLIRARQITAGGEESPDHDDGIEILGQPNPARATGFAPLVFASRLHECGRCLRLDGAYPGAFVDLQDSSGLSLASHQTSRTTVRFHLSRRIITAETLEAHQDACGINALPARSPNTISFLNSTLPSPTINPPLIECGSRVYVSDVFEGASVLLERHFPDGSTVRLGGCFDASTQYFSLPEPLHADEVVMAKQWYPDCEDIESDTTSANVLPIEALTRPRVTAPICEGASRVHVRCLVPDAIITIFLDGAEIGSAVASDTSDVFLVPPLAAGMLEVHQTLCGMDKQSDPVEVTPGGSLERPIIPSQILSCASAIAVEGVHPGAWIRVRQGDALVGESTAGSDTVVVPTVSLEPGRMLFITQTVCGRESAASEVAVIDRFNELSAPEVISVILDTDSIVRVNELRFAGLIVDVFADDVFLGSVVPGRSAGVRTSARPPTPVVRVPIVGSLTTGQQITASVRDCGGESDRSTPVPVIACQGVIRVGIKVLSESLLETLLASGQVTFMENNYRFFGIDVVFNEPEILTDLSDNPRFLRLDDGDREARRMLDSRRDGLAENDIGIYVVEQIMPGITLGFSPADARRSVFVNADNDGFDVDSLAHEIGHALGLLHADEASWPTGNLVGPGLTGSGLGGLANNFTSEEVDIIFSSRFIQPCGTRGIRIGCEP